MNLPFHIARRYFGNYLFRFKNRGGKKRVNSIQILTLISIVTAFIVSAAAVIVLSVFNGLTFLLGNLNEIFYPDLKVAPQHAKVFTLTESQLAQIMQIDGVVHASEVLEEMALLEFNGRQMMATVKGIDSNYIDGSNIEKGMFRGDFFIENEGKNFAVVGLGISNELHVNFRDPIDQLVIYVPQRKQRFTIGPAASLGRLPLRVAGTFSIQQEFDNKYAFIPISALRPLLQYEKESSYVEIKLSETAKPRKVQRKIERIMGEGFTVKNRQQQNESWYKVMRFEKWMSFGILVLIMLIASFNLLSSLTMMVLDKRKDISIVKSMGMSDGATASIFRWQGLLIGIMGALIGAGVASILVLLQQQYGFIPLKGSFVVDSYPIRLYWFDVSITVFSVIVISWLASIYPSIKVQQQTIEEGI